MKKYSTVDELTRDYRHLSKGMPKSILKVAERLRSEGIEPVIANTGDAITIRGGSKKTEPVKKPVNNKKIAELNKQLLSLSNQKMSLENMMINLVHTFPDASQRQVANLKKNTMSLSKAVNAELQRVKNELHKASDTTVPDDIKRLFNQTASYIMNSLKGDYQKATRVVLADSDGTIGLFVVLTDVENGDGSIAPQDVYGLTYSDGNVWFNPSLTNPDVPGNYNVGIALKSANKIAEIKKLFNAQRVADGGIMENMKEPPPVEGIDLTGKIDGVIRSAIRDNDVYVLFDKETSNDKNLLQDGINDVQKYLTHISYLEKAKLRVVYSKPKPVKTGSSVKFSFIPASNYSNLTVNKVELDHLRKIFPETEIAAIRKLLDNLRSDPDNIVEKDFSKTPIKFPKNTAPDVEPEEKPVKTAKDKVKITKRTKYGVVITHATPISDSFDGFLSKVAEKLEASKPLNTELTKLAKQAKRKDGLKPFALVHPINGKLHFAIKKMPKSKDEAIVYLKDDSKKVDMQLMREDKPPMDTNMPFDTYKLVEKVLNTIKV